MSTSESLNHISESKCCTKCTQT